MKKVLGNSYEYAAFLNEHTAWYRPMSPDKVMMWQQKD